MREAVRAGGILWQRYQRREEEGSLPAPLLILHGLFGSSDNWQSQARALAEDGPVTRTVIVPDLPNHGDSLHIETFSYPELADLLWKVLPQVVPLDTPLELLGHSMGGKIAMAMALRQPTRVSRLVVVDIAPVRYSPRHEAILEGMQAVARAAPGSRGEAERILAEHIPEKPVRLFLLKSLVPGGSEADRAGGDAPRDASGGDEADRAGGHAGGDAYRWKLNLDGIRRCYDSISDWPLDPGVVAPYTGPTLFIRGGLSPYITGEGEAAIGPLFPQARITTIPQAGHWVHAEARDAFLSVVRDQES